MLKRNLIIATVVMLVFTFAAVTFAQSNKRKAGRGTKGKVQFQDFHFTQRRAKSPKPKGYNLGDTATHERRSSPGSNIGKPQKGKYVKRPKSFHPTSENIPIYHRQRSKGAKSKGSK